MVHTSDPSLLDCCPAAEVMVAGSIIRRVDRTRMVTVSYHSLHSFRDFQSSREHSVSVYRPQFVPFLSRDGLTNQPRDSEWKWLEKGGRFSAGTDRASDRSCASQAGRPTHHHRRLWGCHGFHDVLESEPWMCQGWALVQPSRSLPARFAAWQDRKVNCWPLSRASGNPAIPLPRPWAN